MTDSRSSTGIALAYRLDHPTFGVELSIHEPSGDWSSRGWSVTPLYAGAAQAGREVSDERALDLARRILDGQFTTEDAAVEIMMYATDCIEQEKGYLDLAMDENEIDASGAPHSGIRSVAYAVPDGYAVVPLLPTPRMVEIGCDNNPTQWGEGTPDGFAADVANDVYVSMVRASLVPSTSLGGEAK